jgi:hypothetical protein
MRTIHYNFRLATVLILVSMLYWGLASLFHQVQLSELIALLFTAYSSERLFALLKWMGPIIGTVDTREQERTLKRLIEHELSRSSRSGSPLVIAAIREEKRTSSHVIEQNLRNTDIVLRSSAGYLLVLMTDTTLEQASHAFKRLTGLVPIKDIVAMDQRILQIAMASQQNSTNGKLRYFTPQELRKMCIEAINAKLATITTSKNEANAPVIYNLFDENPSETPKAAAQSIQLPHV